MSGEFTARPRAIALRLSGRSVKSICSAPGRPEFWFYKWWRRYLESGAEGPFDLTRERMPCRPPSLAEYRSQSAWLHSSLAPGQ